MSQIPQRFCSYPRRNRIEFSELNDSDSNDGDGEKTREVGMGIFCRNPLYGVRSILMPAHLLISLTLFLAVVARGQDYMKCALADGFDFPVGKPDAKKYYIFRGYWPNGHLGEDWNGRGGGNTDLGDPIWSVAEGVVVYSQDVKKGWGNVVIVRHAYRSHRGEIRYVDSLYGHLQKRLVGLHERVKRGQQVGTMGSNRGMYAAHLHLEFRHNLKLGMQRSAYPRDNRCYYSPSRFIKQHRKLRTESKLYAIPVNTFLGQGGQGDPRLTDIKIPKSEGGREIQPPGAREPAKRRSFLDRFRKKPLE